MRSQFLRICSFAFVLSGAVASTGRAQIETIYGMTALDSISTSPGISLVRFNSNAPGAITTIGNFAGVTAGHGLRAMSFQPTTGTLFALSTDGTGAAAQLYTVNLTTAALTNVGSGLTLTGNTFNAVSMGFNPVTNEIRVTSRDDTGNNNFRVNPSSGVLIAQDTNLAWAPGDPNEAVAPDIIGFAHTNNVSGAASTTVLGWDFQTDSLVRIGGVNGTPSPNGGVVTTVSSPTGFLTFRAGMGMAISGQTNTMFVTHDDPATGTSMSLFTRDMVSGAETLVGAFPATTFVSDIAILPVPEPASVLAVSSLVLAGGTWAVRRVRRNAGTGAVAG